MKTITAKFKSKCTETGVTINKGDRCLYDPKAKKVYSLDSNIAKINQQVNNDRAYVQAQEEAYFDNFNYGWHGQ